MTAVNDLKVQVVHGSCRQTPFRSNENPFIPIEMCLHSINSVCFDTLYTSLILTTSVNSQLCLTHSPIQ